MVQTRVTCDVSTGGKVTSSGVRGMLQHLARDVDAWNGIYRAHSNESIDAARSVNNETWFPTDGPRSTWTQPGSIEEIEARLDARLAEVTGRTRKDSVVMRGVVLGLSPEWVEAHTPDWKTDARDREAFMEALGPVVERVIDKCGGAKNVVAISGHFDEEAPQVQLMMTPVTEDGRLRQNDFDLFKSPGSLRKLHKQLREELKASGLDVVMESSERSREHLTNLDYARKADKERAEEIAGLVEERERQQAERADIDAARAQLDKAKAEFPELQRRAAAKGYAKGKEKGLEEGRQEGRKQGEGDARALVAQAEQQARDIVQQAQDTLRGLRDENERLDRENAAKRRENANWDTSISVKRRKHENLDKTLRDKRGELNAVQAELNAAESSRDHMTQLDSDFLDYLLTGPKTQKRYEEFKIGRVKGFPAVVDGTKERYERTVGENKRRTKPKGGGNGQPQGQGQRGGGKGKPKGGGKGGGNGQLGE